MYYVMLIYRECRYKSGKPLARAASQHVQFLLSGTLRVLFTRTTVMNDE